MVKKQHLAMEIKQRVRIHCNNSSSERIIGAGKNHIGFHFGTQTPTREVTCHIQSN